MCESVFACLLPFGSLIVFRIIIGLRMCRYRDLWLFNLHFVFFYYYLCLFFFSFFNQRIFAWNILKKEELVVYRALLHLKTINFFLIFCYFLYISQNTRLLSYSLIVFNVRDECVCEIKAWTFFRWFWTINKMSFRIEILLLLLQILIINCSFLSWFLIIKKN